VTDWFLLGITCLCAFVQIHWTGPSLELPREFESLENKVDSRRITKKKGGDTISWGDVMMVLFLLLFSKEFAASCRNYLSTCVDHEEIFGLISNAWLLVISRELLIKRQILFGELKSASWWALRCLFVQQRIAENAASSIMNEISYWIQQAERSLDAFSDKTKGLFYTELALIAQYYPQMDFEVSTNENQYCRGIRN
jgi:hypothetical protein